MSRQVEFLDRLRRSRPSVLAVAAWLDAKGFVVTTPDNTEDPSWLPTEDHADSGDMWIVTSDCYVRRLEVKQPGIMFTCLNDWPFRREMFLTNVKRASRWRDEPLAHIIVNTALSHAAIVHERTRPRWFQRDVYMKNVGRAESTWIVDPALAQFVQLSEGKP